MSAEGAVLDAAEARARALAAGDAVALRHLLHPSFTWISHTGQRFDMDEYVARNTDGRTVWARQDLGEPDVVVVGDTAVLRTTVTDVVVGADGDEVFRMPVTQVWIRVDAGWRCLAGHAGPRLSGL